ncbi:MAG: hypothetical protein ABSG96_20205 [Terracidiphilus sp.]
MPGKSKESPLDSIALIGTTEQVAEKLSFGRVRRYWHLQGLKPNIDLIGFIGPTEVVPFYKTFKIPAGAGFSAAYEVMPFQNAAKSDFFRNPIEAREHSLKFDGNVHGRRSEPGRLGGAGNRASCGSTLPGR